ncbi:MAG: class IV adenylate cyclase [Planctomycetia bacterium]|nr:class IV adenylate cyclase [Planctomycetia bacterium]
MKFPVVDPAETKMQLKQLGFHADRTEHEVDRYYNAPDRDFVQTDEALRIRQIGENGYLTYKGPKRGSQGKVRKEHEVELTTGSAARMHQILLDLRYIPSIEVRKNRTRYFHTVQKDVTISWDEVEGLGTFIELELLVPESDKAEALTCIQSLAQSLGLEREERRAYLELKLKQSP